MKRAFTDPFDSLPAYEREIIRLRSYELTLVLYYKQEIERRVLDQIASHDRWESKRDPSFTPRAPEGSKARLKKSLLAMVSDGTITEDELREIEKAINFRNDVGHRIDHLFSDLEQSRFSGRWIDPEIRKLLKISEFDHSAVQRMKRVLSILDRTFRPHYNVGTFSMRGHMMFSSSEKTLNALTQQSLKKLKRLSNEREKLVEQLNKELRRSYQMLHDLREQRDFDIRFDMGRMTTRGQEFCYRLFDDGLSDLAISHIFEMKLRSIQARRRAWRKHGSVGREKPVWDAMPAVVTPSRFDD